MIITICLLILVYSIRGKNVKALLKKVKDVLDEWFGPEYSVSDANA